MADNSQDSLAWKLNDEEKVKLQGVVLKDSVVAIGAPVKRSAKETVVSTLRHVSYENSDEITVLGASTDGK